MTDDIKLPPLWIPSAFKRAYSKEDMRQYARAAVIADRRTRREKEKEPTSD